MIGQTISHYRIVEKLGEGGMGVVYKAHDIKLDRTVALKFLPPKALHTEDEKMRIIREAQAAASLSHSNIATVYEIDEVDDYTFIAMEYIDGKGLDEKLNSARLEIREAVDIAIQIAEGLQAAHEKGIIHRDIKSSNVLISGKGQVKLVDFGLAKLKNVSLLTKEGTTLGTVPYMSPEQARGEPVDHRSDIWSLGVVLYEMIAGQRPFKGEYEPALLYSIVNEDHEPIRSHIPDVSPEVVRIVNRALEKDKESRYSSAWDFTEDLRKYRKSLQPEEPVTFTLRTLLLKPRVVMPAVTVVLVVIIVVVWLFNRQANVRWAREEALPEIERLADENRVVEAFLLTERVAQFLPEDRLLHELRDRVSIPVNITSEPSGAEISFRDYRTPDTEFQSLGQTPLEAVRVPMPYGALLWSVKKEGYDPVEVAETPAWGTLHFDLSPAGAAPPGMFHVPEGVANFGPGEPLEVPGFWLDAFEVTNGEYKEFVDAGGYREPRYWQRAIETAGNEFTWEQLMSRFLDSTGRPGPSTCSLGRFPDGMEDHPVAGVSWYEAAAYAEFVGKSLPGVYHWRRAAPWDPYGDILLLSNFEAGGTVPVGSSGAVGRYGHHDVAGNVAEWCWNEGAGGQRYIIGGSWADPSYTFTLNYARSPLDREPDFGFRLAVYNTPPPANLLEPVAIERHDFSQEVPVSDEIFSVYRSLFAYDELPLEPKIELVDDSPRYWRRETVSYSAAYGAERVIAHLFLPRDAEPPYQAVVYVPGSGARILPSIEYMASDIAFFVPRSGRALVWPAYYGMLERRRADESVGLHQPARQHRDRYVRMVNDLQRTIDYLETREDIESDNLAYLGLSLGGEYGPLFTAIEQRFRALVYIAGGYDDFHMLEELPEVQPWNYTPRVTTPTLMINGRSDYGIPVETAQKPMFDKLGVPEEHKRHVILEGGHFPYNMNEVIREILDWLDRYQGPIIHREAE
jgi:eukaryotic-like serine/threonine-protein kinase